MIFFKPEICFKVKDFEESVKDIIKRIKYSTNKYEISTIKEFLCVDSVDEESIKTNFKTIYNTYIKQGEKQIKSMQTFWAKEGENILGLITKELNLSLFGESKAYCMLDCSPLPYLSLADRRITLPINESLDNNICYALNVLVKAFVLNKFKETCSTNINFEYSRDSVYWIMADLVADSLFYHTELKKYAENTAFKYYYGLKIGNQNVIDQVRGKFLEMNILEFIQYVLDFVSKNISVFSKFTNRY